ncbi:hypothetical protein [Mycobacterium sp. 1245111.1]|uniref:hypothetical protein n=1 Tax=Mycobacterium sp. 1245111.1 TaxID=1834073 RepID=UPI000AE06B9B|nr:hypothetical protein [Mycobacterium sp. 1245111.1]
MTTAAAPTGPARDLVAVRYRRQAVTALTTFCFLFFSAGIVISYILALTHGYGTGFGDGRQLPAGTGAHKGGTGFFGDLAILIGTLVLDFALLFGWHWLMLRLDGVADDNPLPAPDDADLSQEASWYYVYSPGLLKVFVVTGWACVAGLSFFAAAILPLALFRYGWN